MHCYMVGGTFEREVNAFLECSGRHNLGIDKLQSYAEKWVWPRGYAHAKNVCQGRTLNGSASEFVSLAPVLE
eukprot:1749345-Pyramimonas_sp.AAC.1